MRITEITGAGMSYYVPQIPRVNPMPEQTDNGQKVNSIDTADYSPNTLDTGRPEQKRPNAGMEDISLSFNKSDSFDYIGNESGLVNLDMEKAVSDMKKDKIFEEYQYFVGGTPAVEYDGGADGRVIRK